MSASINQYYVEEARLLKYLVYRCFFFLLKVNEDSSKKTERNPKEKKKAD